MYKKLLPLVFLLFSTGIVFSQATGVELRLGSALSAQEDSLFIDIFIKRDSNYPPFQLGTSNLPIALNLAPLQIEGDRQKHIVVKGPWNDSSPAYEPMELLVQAQSVNLLISKDAEFGGSGIVVPDVFTLIARLGFKIPTGNCNEAANITWGSGTIRNYAGTTITNNTRFNYEDQVPGFKYSHPFPMPLLEATAGLNDISYRWDVNSFARTYEININNSGYVDVGKTGVYRIQGLNPGQSVSAVLRATKSGNPAYRCEYTLLSNPITTTTNTCPRAPTWRIMADTSSFEYCIVEPNRELVPVNAGGFFSGNGVFQDNASGRWFFNAGEAGLGSHTVSYTLCSVTESKTFTITPTPCVTTIIGPIESVPGSILVRQPKGINTDCDGTIFLSDIENHVIYKVDVLGNITLLAGRQPVKNDDGSISSFVGDNFGEVTAANSLLRNPVGVVVAANGDVYFADAGNHKIKLIRNGFVRTVVGTGVSGDIDGNGETARLSNPQGLAISPDSRYLYITDRGNNKVKRYDIQEKRIVTFAGTGSPSTIVSDGFALQINLSNLLAGISANENHVFISDNASNAIRRIDVNKDNPDDLSQNRIVVINNRLPGFEDGPFEVHQVANILDVSVDAFGNLFFADAGNNSIRFIDPTRFMTTIAGNGTSGNQDGPARQATFNEPSALSMYVKGFIDVADNSSKGGLIRRVAINNFREGMFAGLNPDYTYCVGGAPSTLTPQFAGGNYTISPDGNEMLYKNAQGAWVFNPRQAGTFTLSYTYQAGFCSETFTQDVVVNPLPTSTLAPAVLLCEGSTVVLDAGEGGASYVWSGPGIAANTTGRTITVNQPGTYRVVVSAAGCSAEFQTQVTTQPSPTATLIIKEGPSEICNGQQVRLLASGGDKYTWYLNDEEQAEFADQPEILVNKAGVWKVVVQANLNGCTDAATITIINVNPVATLTPSGSESKCIGQDITLTASGGDTYKWYLNGVEQTQFENQTVIVVSQEGTWQVEVGENGISCTDVAQVIITDVQTPTQSPAVSSNNVSECEGNTLQLSVNAQPGLNYRWVRPDGEIYFGANLNIVNATAQLAGTYRVFARRGICEYEIPTEIEVIIKPLPTSTLASAAILCEGSTVLLNAGNDGETYVWTLPGGTSFSGSSTLVASSIGRYEVAITKNGCTKVFSANITSAPRPSVALRKSDNTVLPAIVELCPGENLEVVASGGTAANQYTWLKDGVVFSAWNGSTRNTITETGVWSVVLTVGTNNCADTANVDVRFVTPPAAPALPTADIQVCADNTLTLSAPTVSGITYRWEGPNGFTSTQQNPTINNVTQLNAGIYRVYAISTLGCVSETASEVRVTVNPLPSVSIVGLGSEYCVSSAPVVLSGQPQPGIFSVLKPDGELLANQGSFNPAWGAGTYIVYYTLTQTPTQPCVATVSQSVVVSPVVTPQLIGLAPEYCANAANATVSASVAGGQFILLRNNTEIERITANTYTLRVTTLQEGLYELVYRIEGDNCSGSTRQFIRIAPVITPVFALNDSYCPSSQPLVLQASPQGGIFTVNGQPSNGTLDISVPGTYVIGYSFDQQNGNCEGSGFKTIVVSPLLPVSITGLSAQYCISADRVQLQGYPEGGIFTVNGTPVTFFDPSVLGAGIHNVSYTVNNGSCNGTVNQQVEVTPVVTPVIANLSASYCIGDAAFTLRAEPVGGSFFINGIRSSVFSPAQLGAGTHTVEYRLSAEGCSGTVSAQVSISSQPEARILNLASLYCSTADAFVLAGDPRGGYFTIGGDSVTVFNPALYAGSTVQVTYILNRAGECEARTSQSVTIGNELQISMEGIQTLYCISQPAVTLRAMPQGGVFKLKRENGEETILANNQLDPATTGAGTYQLIYEITGTCAGREEITIRIQEQLQPEIANLEEVYCTSAPSVVLQGMPAGGRFEREINGVITAMPGGLFAPSALAAGTYTIRYIFDNGSCQGSTTRQVQITAPERAVIGGNNQQCIGAPFALTASGSGEFRWFRNNVLVQAAGGNTLNEVLADAGTYAYTVVLRNNQTCVDTSQVFTVVVNPLPVAGLAPTGDHEICQGEAFELRASGGATYEWLRNGVRVTGTTGNTLSATQAGVYTVVAISEAGCRDTTATSANIIVNPLPLVDLGANQTLCEGETVVIGQEIEGVVSYKWTSSANVTWTSAEPTLEVSEAGTYTLEVTNEKGCKASSSVNIRFIQKVAVVFTPEETECNNDQLALIAQATGDELVYFWSTTGNGELTRENELNALYTSNRQDIGPVEFTLSVYNSCSRYDTTFVVEFKESPDARFSTSAVNNEVFLLNNSVRFTHDFPKQGETYAWSFGDGSAVSTEPSPSYSYRDGGDYEVKLVVTNESGCIDSTMVTVKVLTNKVVYVPNIFSPNHPQPENQTLRVFATNVLNEDFMFVVYNRWGQVVFETRSFQAANSTGWNGITETGANQQQTGVYTYVVKGKFVDGSSFEKTGTSTLIK
jgi:PKD repeat protein